MYLNENVCFSGGAAGADLAWGDAARLANHKVIHYLFGKHKNANVEDAQILTQEQLNLADPTLIKANKILKRTFPTSNLYVNNLLRRNYYQVIDSDSVYAISELDGSSVFGGTAWAVEMFKVLNPISQRIYVFDQKRNSWFKWLVPVYPDLVGSWCEIQTPSKPKGKWTGIGTRNLLSNGQSAITNLFSLKDI